MMIAVAGPYSAETEEERKSNLDAMNTAAAEIYMKGHIPVIGVNAALFITEKLEKNIRKKAMTEISLAVVEKCDALLLLKESPGANLERDLILSQGKKIYESTEEIPFVRDI
ncbi:MAG: DUF4406 domain-containing protein [Ignavibacteria bacterium]|nr:DUF4406 domain-containing protein [Ignavibacteria bacterium]